MKRSCYVCATRGDDVEGSIPLCDFCESWIRKSTERRGTPRSLRTELRTEPIALDVNAFESFEFLPSGN